MEKEKSRDEEVAVTRRLVIEREHAGLSVTLIAPGLDMYRRFIAKQFS